MITNEEISKIITNIINNNYKITANEISKIIDFKNQQEELKNDIKKYFELEGNYQKSSHEYHEMEYIKSKLIEVGK